jgi:hypothetical protein
MRVQLAELDFERLGRMRGEVLAHEVAALSARVRMLEAEVAMLRAQLAAHGPGEAFNTELRRLAEAYGFDADAGWQTDATTRSLVRLDDNQG